ncbi:MAG: hypothetical protein H6608_04055 [Flavobacteriales bacterium]|nr:hypothetical protein [Bacteroidota bacterium]MCB9240280.1 hypothetical protein [Flavobacteriales bacterium]
MITKLTKLLWRRLFLIGAFSIVITDSPGQTTKLISSAFSHHAWTIYANPAIHPKERVRFGLVGGQGGVGNTLTSISVSSLFRVHNTSLGLLYQRTGYAVSNWALWSGHVAQKLNTTWRAGINMHYQSLQVRDYLIPKSGLQIDVGVHGQWSQRQFAIMLLNVLPDQLHLSDPELRAAGLNQFSPKSSLEFQVGILPNRLLLAAIYHRVWRKKVSVDFAAQTAIPFLSLQLNIGLRDRLTIRTTSRYHPITGWQSAGSMEWIR